MACFGRKNVDMNDLIEFLVKASLLQDSRTREMTEYLTRLKTASDVKSIMQYRMCCYNFLQMLEANQIPFPTETQRHQQILACRNEINRCNLELRRLQGKAIVDAMLSQMTQTHY
jgi:hypothetical protein